MHLSFILFCLAFNSNFVFVTPPPSNSLLTVPKRCSDVVSLRCFGVRVSVMFHFMFVHYTFSFVWVAEWQPFGKYLPAQLVIRSHCILSICNIYLFPVLVLRAGFAF